MLKGRPRPLTPTRRKKFVFYSKHACNVEENSLRIVASAGHVTCTTDPILVRPGVVAVALAAILHAGEAVAKLVAVIEADVDRHVGILQRRRGVDMELAVVGV